MELRASGRLVGRGWAQGPTYWQGLCQALGALRQQQSATAANELMFSLGSHPRELPLADAETWERLQFKRWRGLFGYEIRRADDQALVVLISPFDFVASNRSFIQLFRNAIAPWGLTVEEAIAGGITLSEFDTERFRLDLRRDDASAVPLVRGTRLVSLDEVTLDSLAALQKILGDYLIRSVQADGRMRYLYHPSRGSEDKTRDNSIRQWMATRALIRVWRQRGSGELLHAVRTNIEYNLKSMYVEEGDVGLIVENHKVKLGAVALAALRLSSHRSRSNSRRSAIASRRLSTCFGGQMESSARSTGRPTQRLPKLLPR